MAAARVVLVGAGHAHLHVVEGARRLREAGAEVSLVEPDAFWYSGLATGVLGGRYGPELDRVDPEPLCRRAGVILHRDRAVEADLAGRTLRLVSGRRLPWDFLSLNVGSEVPLERIPGAREHARSVKPIRGLWSLRRTLERRFVGVRGDAAAAEAMADEPRAVVVGGGETGCEVAANLEALADRLGAPLSVVLLTDLPRLLSDRPVRAGRRAARLLRARGIRVLTDRRVVAVEEGGVRTDDGRALRADWVVCAHGLRAPRLVEAMGLPVGREGGLHVGATLQAAGVPGVFGAGDCIDFGPRPLRKLGVHAVRQAPVLLRNLEAALRGTPPRPYEPPDRCLTILNLGRGRGLALWGHLHWLGRGPMWLKDRIDRRFLDRYRPG